MAMGKTTVAATALMAMGPVLPNGDGAKGA